MTKDEKSCHCTFCKEYRIFDEVFYLLKTKEANLFKKAIETHWTICEEYDLLKNLRYPKLKEKLAAQERKIERAKKAILVANARIKMGMDHYEKVLITEMLTPNQVIFTRNRAEELRNIFLNNEEALRAMEVL